jgi:predicted nuclease of predicted toxin-antitoxin system
MKFLVDAQLSYRLAKFIQSKGHEVIHTDAMPNRERSSDREIRVLARLEGRILLTKDKDFQATHLLSKDPKQLILISTGNLVNRELIALFEANWAAIESLLGEFDFLELTNSELIAHGSI